jgi:hypothetical protein
MIEYEKKYIAGLLTGLTSTFIFNPIDKSLFLMSTENRSFFSKLNWINPYRGVSIALIGKTVQFGLYFPLIDTYSTIINKTNINHNLKPFAIGSSIGLTTSLLNNPLNLVKFHGWNTLENKKSFIDIIKNIYKSHGVKGLMHGFPATCQRDMIFSTLYTYYIPQIKMKYQNDITKQMIIISSASCIFTIFSAPFNYVRNVKYHEIENHSDSTIRILLDLIKTSYQQPNTIKYICKKLCLGSGSIRVGIGMAFGQILYDKLLLIL